jgi:hypothetical protein
MGRREKFHGKRLRQREKAGRMPRQKETGFYGRDASAVEPGPAPNQEMRTSGKDARS